MFSERIASAVTHASEQTLAMQNLTPEERLHTEAIIARTSDVLPTDPGILTLRAGIGTVAYRKAMIAALLTIAAITNAVAKVEERQLAEEAKAREDAEQNIKTTEEVYVSRAASDDFTNLDGNGQPITGSVATVAEVETVAAV